MRISTQWLLSLLDLDGREPPSPTRVAAILTSVGLEVEGLTPVGAGVESIVVGEVRSKRRHPQADRLTLVALFDGNRVLNVVCGAPNVPEPGGKVAFAPVGARLPGGMEIGAREVRGEFSEGMICSEDELEIGADDGGILILPAAWAAGDRLVDRVPEIVDTIIEIGVTPNRPDALGHVGVARDVAVKLGVPLRLPGIPRPSAPVRAELVTMAAPARCGRYLGYAIDGITVAPSPLSIRVRLHRLGLRAINNCVDITNLVLFEQGQPLHAFDRDRLGEGRVVVRMAHEGEAFAALDGSKHELCAGDLTIADATAPQALAGVMGGADSMVHPGTRAILLEAAWFEPRGIRATARRHGMASDSSYRFERGVDPGPGLERAALRALSLFESVAGGRCVAVAEVAGDRPPRPAIRLRLPRIEHLLGMPVAADEARRILMGLGVDLADAAGAPASAGEAWICHAPSHRPDLQREEDLIEEVMRFHGLEDLPARSTVPSATIVPATDERAEIRDRLVDALREAGVHEHVSYAFTAPEKLRPFLAPGGEASIVALQNPLRTPLSVMRTHLLPGLLDALEINVARHGHPVRLFEVGRTYAWPGAPAIRTIDRARAAALHEIDPLLPAEREWAAILFFGTGDAAASTSAQAAVGALVHALARLGHAPRVLPPDVEAAIDYLHPGVQVALAIDAEEGPRIVGYAGELHPDALAGRDLAAGARVHVGAIDLGALPPRPTPVARERPRFPATSRDLSLELPTDVPARLVVDALEAAEAALQAARSDADPPRLAGDGVIDGVEVVEDYRGAGVPEGHRALLLRLHYRAQGRTVTDDEVQALHAGVIEAACATLRPLAPALRIR